MVYKRGAKTVATGKPRGRQSSLATYMKSKLKDRTAIVRKPRVPRVTNTTLTVYKAPFARYNKKNHDVHHQFAITNNNAGIPLKTPNTYGNFVTVATVSRSTINTSTVVGQPVFLIAQFTGTDITWFSINSAGVVTGYSSPQLFSAAPTAIRSLKLQLELVNQTVFTSISGTVRTLVSPSMFNWKMGTTGTAPNLVPTGTLVPTSYNNIVNTMNSHPDVRTFSAKEFADSGKTFISYPASFNSYSTYYDYNQASANGATGTSISLFLCNSNNIPPDYISTPDPVQSVIIIELNPSAVTNTYDVTCKTQVAARFPLDSLYSNLAYVPKFVKADAFNKSVLELSQVASGGTRTADMSGATGQITTTS